MSAALKKRDRHWSADYLGIEWLSDGLTRAGISCWGLVRLCYAERNGVTLPSYVGAPDDLDGEEIADMLNGCASRWIEIDESEVREFDLVTFQLGGIEAHVGVIVPDDTGYPRAFLHITEGVSSRLERFGFEPWWPMVSRFLRYSGEDRTQCTTVRPSGNVIAVPGLGASPIGLEMSPEATVLDAVKLAFPGLAPEQYGRLRVTVGHQLIHAEAWEDTRPHDVVLIRVAPGGLLQSLLAVALTVAAIATAQLWLGPAIAGLIGVTSAAGIGVVTAVTTAVLPVGGTLRFNALKA